MQQVNLKGQPKNVKKKKKDIREIKTKKEEIENNKMIDLNINISIIILN